MTLTELQGLPEGTPMLYARWITERGAISLFANRTNPDKFIATIRAVTLIGRVEDEVEGPVIAVRSMADGNEIRTQPNFLHSDLAEAHSYLTWAVQFKLNSVKIT